MKYGYARCSTNEDKQDIQRQIRELKAVGAEKVIFEYEHGDAKIKQNLQLLLDTARGRHNFDAGGFAAFALHAATLRNR